MRFEDFADPGRRPPGPPVELEGARHLLAMRERTKAEIALLEQRLASIVAEVDRLLGDAEVGLLDGKEIVKRVRVNKNQFSAAALKEADPATYDKYVRVSSYEQMRWKEMP